jgi:hypothetical protein
MPSEELHATFHATFHPNGRVRGIRQPHHRRPDHHLGRAPHQGLAGLDEGLIVKPGQLQARGPTQGREGEKGQALHHLELTRSCDWALAEDEPWVRAFVLLSRTGLRSGEILALGWGTGSSITPRRPSSRAVLVA